MKLVLPDHSIKEVKDNISGLEACKTISISLAKAAICVKVDDKLQDLAEPITHDCNFEVITKSSPEAMEVLRHSAAHLLAEAVKHLYPDAMFAYGPATEEGFFYDIKFSSPISETEDLPKIEKEMLSIIKKNETISRRDISYEEAKDIFKNQKYKSIHIDELKDKNAPISIYSQGDFIDLCLGPHLKSTGEIKAVKLLSTSACYFQGNKDNDSLTRIYGTAFFSQKELDDYLHLLEERKESDHKKIGKEMGLFMISDYGPGLPFWLPNGMLLRHQLENYYWELMMKNGYNMVMTPQILSRTLWETSGHWREYKDNMYITKVDKKPFAIKPMNCPGAILVYQNQLHSYRDLPYRVAELGLVHRHEASGALNGLFRVRSFTQDDAHIFIAFDQIGDEIRKLLKIFDEVYSLFNLQYHIELSTRPLDKYVGKISTWDKAEATLKECLQENHIPYKINPGDGAFYGPKLDFKFKDSLNRIWQCGTIQLDMQLPHRFKCTYIDKDGQEKEPVMLHRAIFGSIERFVGIITENFKGSFPTWLAPEQVRLLVVNNTDIEQMKYAKRVLDHLNKLGIRASLDDRNEKLGYKFHDSQTMKVSYTVVIGKQEALDNTINYRIHGSKEAKTTSLKDFIKLVETDIKTRACYRK